MRAQSVTRPGRLARGHRWVASVCAAVVLWVGAVSGNDALAASSLFAAATGRDSGAGASPTTEVARDLSSCKSAVGVARPSTAALMICRGVATALWETNHTRIDAYVLLGRALGRLGRFPEALDAAYAAKQLNADDPDTYLFEAWVLLNLHRLEEARGAAQTAIRLSPRDAAGYLGLAFITENFGLFDQAIVVARRGFRASRDLREKTVLGAFTAFTQGGNLDTATQVVRRFADRVSETRAEAAFLLGGLLRRRGDNLEAAKLLRRAIAWGPETTGKRIAMAETLRELGREGEAVAQLRRAAQLALIPEIEARIRKTLATAESQLPAAVPLAEHLADIGRVLPLRGASTIRVAPDYAAVCRYDRSIESVAERRRQTNAKIRLSTYLENGRVAMTVQMALSRGATGGRSPVQLSLAASFEANGKLD